MSGAFPGGPVVKDTLPLQGTLVPSLVGELKFCMQHDMPKKKEKKPKCLTVPTVVE